MFHLQNLVNHTGDYLELISTKAFQILRDTCFKESILKPWVKRRMRPDSQIPFLSTLCFNSGKYDLNITKPYFAQRFLVSSFGDDEEDEDEDEGGFRRKVKKFVIKKNNEFLAVSTPKLKFLDIKKFIAPGVSCAEYLAAYEVEEEKGFFPYEYITSLEKLDDTSLPPREAFHSSLRNSDLSQENYNYLCQVWRGNGMTSLRDLLTWYNNKDPRHLSRL